MKMSV